MAKHRAPSLASEILGEVRQVEQLQSSTDRVIGGMEEMDQDARDDAAAAMRKITSHEEVCEMVRNQNTAMFTRIEATLALLQKAMDDRIGKIPASIIAVMAGIIGYLADRAFPFH